MFLLQWGYILVHYCTVYKKIPKGGVTMFCHPELGHSIECEDNEMCDYLMDLQSAIDLHNMRVTVAQGRQRQLSKED